MLEAIDGTWWRGWGDSKVSLRSLERGQVVDLEALSYLNKCISEGERGCHYPLGNVILGEIEG